MQIATYHGLTSTIYINLQDGATPFHALCANEAVHPDLLSVVLDFDSASLSVAVQDKVANFPIICYTRTELSNV